jgi:hypothetical protein
VVVWGLGHADDFAVGETAQGLDFLLDWVQVSFPLGDYVFHGWSGGGEVLPLAIVVHNGVVVCQHGVLDLNLGG